MKKWLLLLFLFTVLKSFSQNDVLMLEKKGDRLMTYGAGSLISLKTIYNQWFTGEIEDLRHDTIYINGQAFNYKEVSAVKIEGRKLNYSNDGFILMEAGVGVLLLGAVNGLYRGDQAKDWYKTSSFIVSGALLLVGYLLIRSRSKTYNLGKKFKLEYLTINPYK
ncbi:MAG: hypothetical protein JST87_16445 [Bacteroidetes bacterium]|nr:hypothetical protein [Bacteroidota bacterium]MBS1933395.1 hypothetical protein [Bacteroidota bacterium]